MTLPKTHYARPGAKAAACGAKIVTYGYPVISNIRADVSCGGCTRTAAFEAGAYASAPLPLPDTQE